MSILSLINKKDNKNLLIKDGKLLLGKSDTEACCCDCKTCFHYIRATLFTAKPGQISHRQTFTAPDWLTPPYTVTIVGGVDDVLLKDGEPWPPGADPDAPAHGFNYSWTEDNSSFELAAKDTKGANIAIEATVCFMPLDSNPTTQCEPTTEL